MLTQTTRPNPNPSLAINLTKMDTTPLIPYKHLSTGVDRKPDGEVFWLYNIIHFIIKI